MVKNAYGQPGHGALKLTLSQEWADGMNWIFEYWKIKGYINCFWLGLLKKWMGVAI